MTLVARVRPQSSIARTRAGSPWTLRLVLASALVVTLGACGPSTELAVGVVVGVDARSLTDVRSFSLRTSDGRRLDFELGHLEDPTAFPVSHLSQHMATALPVAVAYRLENHVLVATRLADAPWATP